MGGLAPLPSKIVAVLNIEVLSKPAKLEAVLELIEYCSRFVPYRCTVFEPFRGLIRKGVPLVWSSQVEASFQRIKSCILNVPILTVFNPSLLVVVTTDASNCGLGAVLQEQHGNQVKTVAFASRFVPDPQRRYSAGEEEDLAYL